MIRIASLLLAGFLGCVASLGAAPPALSELTPRGAERGKAVELVVTGANLTPKTRLLLPFQAVQETIAEMKPNPAQVKVKLTIDPATPLGSYPVRALTEEGVTAPLLFVVDAFPTTAEAEDNSSFVRAQKVVPPVVIDGTCAGGDLDFFRFPAKKGQRLVLEVESARLGSALLPMLRLTDERRRLLASDDRQALQGDARIIFVAPLDGDYVVELADTRYRGGTPSSYRLKIADYDVIDEIFPLGGKRGTTGEFTLRGATLAGDVRVTRPIADPLLRGAMPLVLDGVLRPGLPVPRVAVGTLPERNWIKGAGRDPRALDLLPPITVNSRLEKAGDVDRFQFPAEPGQRYRIAVEAEAFGSRLDGVLRVTDQTGRQLALADDGNLPPAAPGLPGTLTADPTVDLPVPAGATLIQVELRDQRGRGGLNYVYRLTVEPALADFTLQTTSSELNVPRGGVALLPINVTRRGYAGPIELTVRGLPPGWTVAGGHVPLNGTAGALTLAAPAAANLPPQSLALTVEGHATVPGVNLLRFTEVHVILNRETGGPNSVLLLNGLALGLSAAESFALSAPAVVEAVIGYPTAVPMRIARAKDQAKLSVQLTARDPQTPTGQPLPPERLTVANPPAATGDDATLTITPGVNLPDGRLDLIVEGKATIGNAVRTVHPPIVPVAVRKPFELQPTTPRIALAPGATTIVKVALRRQPVFKEPVQVRLDGLPAGVTLAKPLGVIPAAGTEIALELRADPKAAAVATDLTLTCTTTLGGRVYSHPPLPLPLAIQK